VIVVDNMVGIVFSKFKERSLADFEKLILLIDFNVAVWDSIGLRVDEYKTDDDDPEEAESIAKKIWKEGETCHFKECLILRFNFPVEQTGAEGCHVFVNFCLELPHALAPSALVVS
jgi:hypothetical protein